MRGMIMHHAQAIEITSMIESRTDNRHIRLLGERISKSQSDEIEFIKRWLEARGESFSLAVPGRHDMHMPNRETPTHHALMPGMLTPKQIAALKNAKGAEFDRLFLTGMIQHHKGALIVVKELLVP